MLLLPHSRLVLDHGGDERRRAPHQAAHREAPPESPAQNAGDPRPQETLSALRQVRRADPRPAAAADAKLPGALRRPANDGTPISPMVQSYQSIEFNLMGKMTACCVVLRTPTIQFVTPAAVVK